MKKPFCQSYVNHRFFSLAATAAVTVIIIAATTAAIAVAAERYQKKYDDEKPDNIVVIENIAKTIHKISSLRRQRRRFHQSVKLNSEKRLAFPICYHTMTGRKFCYCFSISHYNKFFIKRKIRQSRIIFLRLLSMSSSVLCAYGRVPSLQ